MPDIKCNIQNCKFQKGGSCGADSVQTACEDGCTHAHVATGVRCNTFEGV